MLRNKKGITLVTLVVTVILLATLATITISTSVELLETSKIQKHITTMSLIKIEVEKIFEDFEFENDVSSMTGKDVSKFTITGASKFTLVNEDILPMQNEMSEEERTLLEKNINDVKDSNNDGVTDVDVNNLWYKWTTATLNELKIKYSDIIAEDEYFIVNYATGEVILPKGVELRDRENITIYSLTGLKEE